MAAAGAARGHEPRRLQREFDERVGEGHPVIPPREVVEVPHVEAVVRLPIEVQDPLHLGARGREVRGALPAPIEQPEDGVLLIASSPSSQRARIDAQNIGGLQPRQSARQRPHDHLLVRHGPLHRGRRKRLQHLLGC
jgi:hypothetical protein